MNKTILLSVMLSLFFIAGNVFAGNEQWTKERSTGNVDFYYQLGECNGQKVIFLKFDNKNDYDVVVKWKEIFNDNLYGQVFESNAEKQITLAPGITSKEDCNPALRSECLINLSTVTPTHVIDLQKFQFTDVTVKAAR